MSKKGQIKKAIDNIEREIRALEQKRERAQNAIMRAMIAKVPPSPEDEQYFNTFSALIDNDRLEMRKLLAELAELENSKKKKKKDK